jgi:hypothetical protein
MTSFQKFALFAVIALAIYVMSTHDHSETSKTTKKNLPIIGWEQLDACSPMQSLDGTRELTFFEDHTVKLLEREPKTHRALSPPAFAGTWALEPSSKRYLVTLAQQQKSYVLVQPENSEMCILLSGELAAANIGESWFGPTLQDMYSD